MNKPEKAYKGCGWSAIAALLLMIAWLIVGASCTTTKYVSVPEVHEVHYHHTDSVHQIDSVTREKETIIMQLDSAAMLEYGIRLEKAERAWLVRNRELERQIQQLAQSKTDTVVRIDSIPFEVKVPVEVEKELSFWQRLRLGLGNIMLALIGMAVLYGAAKLYLKIHGV